MRHSERGMEAGEKPLKKRQRERKMEENSGVCQQQARHH